MTYILCDEITIKMPEVCVMIYTRGQYLASIRGDRNRRNILIVDQAIQ